MGHFELNTSNIKLCLGAAEVSAAYLGDEKVYPVEATTNYLAFENLGNKYTFITLKRSDESIGWAQYPLYNLEFSYDCQTWYVFDPANRGFNYIGSHTVSNGGIPIESKTDEDEYIKSKVYVRGNNTSINSGVNKYVSINFEHQGADATSPDTNPNIAASGNIMSLLSKTGFDELTSVPDYCFYSLFLNCTTLTTPPELPATTVGQHAYQNMFYGCTSLTTAPVLPATTLATYCYNGMFYGCAALTTAPALPATTLATRCCYNMFKNCTSLTTTPALPATTLANECYYNMFANCTSLTTANTLPATRLASYCYCGMFSGCTALTSAPALPATALSAHCYEDMFIGCTALTTAPDLPANSLKMYCYQSMFYNCTSLNYIKALFTTTPSTSYTRNWVDGVSATGTFVKHSRASWDVTGTNGIPTGWTVETASA